MDRPEMIQAMGLVATYWPHWKLPTDRGEASVTVDAWLRLLGDLDPDWVTAAIEAYAVTGAEFAPGPGVLRKRAIELGSPDGTPDADAAWGEVIDQIARVGYVGHPSFSHPAVETTVAAMGWLNLCASEDQMVDRAHFLKLYAEVRQRTTFESTAPPSVKSLLRQVSTGVALGHGSDGPRHVLDAPDPGAGG